MIKKIIEYLKKIFSKKETDVNTTAEIDEEIKNFYKKDKQDNDISH